MSMETVSTFFAMPSFEPRSTTALVQFLGGGGKAEAVKTARVSEKSSALNSAIQVFHDLGVQEIPFIDRKNSRSLWDWVWANAKDVQGEVIVDATCFTRELIGMILFALSVRREHLVSVTIHYVPAGLNKYATQNDTLDPKDRWLSQGVYGIRSIIGYPGDFRIERRRHVIALAGHEPDRLLETIELLEPDELSISNERSNSSTVEGAAEISQAAVEYLRKRIQLPVISGVEFSADSIEATYESITMLLNSCAGENITLVPMNTKLSFIGAALAALHNQDVRLVYAVPDEYNPLYSSDQASLKSFDITEPIKAAKTTPVPPNPNE